MADVEFSDDEDETTLRRRIGSHVLPEFVTVEIETLTTDRAGTSSLRRSGFQVPPQPEIVEVETSTTDRAETSSQRRSGFQVRPEPKIVEVETSTTDRSETSSQRRSGFQVPPEPEIIEVGITSNDIGETRRPGWPGKRIQKVPPLLLKKKENTEDYIPAVVSVGPYHHGKPELSLAEGFKPKALDLFVMGGRQNLEFYYDRVLEMVGEIKNCYERRSVQGYSDHELARMVLLDACFIIVHMELSIPEPLPERDMYRPQTLKEHKRMTMVQHLGLLIVANVLRDMFLLENQIPLRVVKILINLRYGNSEGQMLLNRFLNGTLFGEFETTRSLALQNMEEPLHLLEAFRRLLVSDCFEPKKHRLCLKCKWLCCFRVEQEPHASPPINAEIGPDSDLESGLDLQNNADLASRLGPTPNANLATAVSSATSSMYNKFLCCSRVQETHSNLATITMSSVHNKFLCCSRVQETHGNTGPSIYNMFLCCTTVQETHDNQATNTNMNASVDPRTRANQPCSNPVTGIGQTTNRCSHISNFLSRIRVHRGVTREGSKVDQKIDLKKYAHSFRSATDLKAKGIYFKPSSSRSLKDVKFNSYLVYAQLELPTWGVSIYTKVFFLNMLAYEMSPNTINDGVVTSYINLMNSLIESTEDVKELREQKILYNMLGSDEQVMDVFKEIKTYGDPLVFHDLQEKIQAHYNSKMKTWIAELIHTHFRTPWTVIGLLAAMSLLAIASVNVYYSIHKKSKT